MKLEDDLEAAKERQPQLEKQFKELEAGIAVADNKVSNCVGPVIQTDPATRKLASWFVEQERRLKPVRQALQFIETKVPDDLRELLRQALDAQFQLQQDTPIACAGNRRIGTGSFRFSKSVTVDDFAGQWRQAIEGLKTDPDAELPSTGE
jgi:hypothetical protein